MKNLEPKNVWAYFEALNNIPRPSGHVKQVSDYVADFGRQLGLETQVDQLGSVLIRKPATAGYENHPGVLLQAHLDMVPQKDDSLTFDFTKDPITTTLEGDWLRANGTTLGADDGLGVAMAMAVLADNGLAHPALEALFTVDEETGMYGAFALPPKYLKSGVLLNLDTETEGEFIIGCAGGVDATATFTYEPVPVPKDYVGLKIAIDGGKGGHSGLEIGLQHANANKLLFTILKEVVSKDGAILCSVNGGNMRNAIPRSAMAIVTLPISSKQEVLDCVTKYATLFKKEYSDEPALTITATDTMTPTTSLPAMTQDFLIHAIIACPHGVYRTVPGQPTLVETSNNLAIIETKDNTITVCCLARSSSEDRKEEIENVIQSVFALADAKIEFTGSYPGWQPNFNSRVAKIVSDTYQELFHQSGEIKVVHAGLECGIINRYYDLDICSFGPTIEHPHTPQEHTYVPSVGRTYELLKAVLVKL